MKDDHIKYVLGTCVLVARMNPSIVMPPWLAENNICVTSQAEFKIKIEQHGILYLFEQDGFHWECSPSNLIVGSDDENSDCGERVASVLELLVHTPVKACGNNFRYKIISGAIQSTLGRLLETSLCQQLSARKYFIEEATLKYGISHNDAMVNVDFIMKSNQVSELNFNFHRDSPSSKDAISAARNWRSDQDYCRRLLNDLLEECNNG